MPQRKNIKGDLGTTKVASDSYDIDNIYLSEEGWVYRHYKKADKSVWWDEIIVAGQAPTDAPDNALATNPDKLGVEDNPPFEVGGDDINDFEYSPLYGNDVTGGGVPSLDITGEGNEDTSGDDGETPAPPATEIDEVTVSGNEAPTNGDTETYTASVTTSTSDVTYDWTISAGGNIISGQNTDSAVITWNATGASTVSCEVGSTDETWNGVTQSDSLSVSVAPVPPPETSIGDVNLDTVPSSMTVGVDETFAASISGDATVTWQWTKSSGVGNATFSAPTSSTTQIQVDAAGDYVFTATASSDDAGLVGGSPISSDTTSITASNPAPAGVTLTLTGAEAGNSAYQTDAGNNASVTLTAGQTLTITNNSGGHPVDIVQSDGGDQVTEGTLTGAPAGDGETVTWDTTGVTPGDYYYQCTSHAAMIGTITVTA